jgi:cystathionine beta-synthase
VRKSPPASLADVVGSLNERGLLERVFRDPGALSQSVAASMGEPLKAVDVDDSVDRVFSDLSGGAAAVVVAREGVPEGVLTRSDLLEYLAHHPDGSSHRPS